MLLALLWGPAQQQHSLAARPATGGLQGAELLREPQRRSPARQHGLQRRSQRHRDSWRHLFGPPCLGWNEA